MADLLPIAVEDVAAFVRRAGLRMPFRFGNACVEELEILYVAVRIAGAAGAAPGWAAQTLSPLWFDKDPKRSPEAKRERLLTALREGISAWRAAGAGPLGVLHDEVAPAVERACAAHGIDGLAASFGVAIVEQAVLDAICRATERTLHEAVRQDLPGLGPEVACSLPPRPVAAVAVRHTVGLGDPLVAADVLEPLGDGLPESVEEAVARYGLRWLKVKIGGDPQAAAERLARLDEVLSRVAWRVACTLDLNEQLEDMESARRLVERLAGDPDLRSAWARVAWIEQPVRRDRALEGDVVDPLRAIQRRLPVILDESDAADETLERALALGYRGVSAKSCKGVVRALRHHARLARAGSEGGWEFVHAAEDLTCPPVVALQQDLALAASLGVPHAERNAHHYLRGLSHLDESERREALRRTPRLYELLPDGVPTLRIREGVVDLGEVVASGFGAIEEPDVQALDPLT